MARSFRLFGKKRGHRRTGSKALATAGESLFFAFLLAIGSVFLVVLLAKWVVPEWRANHEFIEQAAIVLDKRIAEDRDSDGKLVFRPEARIEYEVNNRQLQTWTYDVARAWLSSREDAQRMLDRIDVGREYYCWYDPLDPTRAVLVRGYSWWFWLLLLVPAGFIVIGGIGLIHALWQWGKSSEHLAARGQLGRIDFLEELHTTSKDFPAIPSDTDLTNSPGTHLKYRLPIHTSQGWRLFTATTACLLWNGIVAMFIVVAIHKHWRGEAEWRLDLFIVPFMIVGGFLIYYFVRELLIATGVGPTLLEISGHPLWPGKTYQLFFEQSGHLTINRLEVTLECEELSTYRQGTDARTDRRLVYCQQLFRTDNVEIRPAEPFSATCELPIPLGVMHSFKADHNEVQWKLVVCGHPEGWPDFERRFPVVVYPPSSRPEEFSVSPAERTQSLTISN